MTKIEVLDAETPSTSNATTNDKTTSLGIANLLQGAEIHKKSGKIILGESKKRDKKRDDSAIVVNGTLVWAEKEKALEWLTRREPRAHKYTIQELDSAAKIIENFENPTILGEGSKTFLSACVPASSVVIGF